MALTPLHHVSINVSNLDRSADFYSRVLGLRETMRAPVEGQEGYLRLPEGTTGRMAMLQADGGPTGMVELLELDVAVDTTPPRRPGDPGVWMICFEIVDESMEDALSRIEAEGAPLWAEPNEVSLAGYPPFRVALIEDPDGLLIELLDTPTEDEVREFRRSLRSAH